VWLKLTFALVALSFLGAAVLLHSPTVTGERLIPATVTIADILVDPESGRRHMRIEARLDDGQFIRVGSDLLLTMPPKQ
jgi:hypothetical protein